MIFEQIPIGGDRNFAYLIADEQSREAAVVDPAYSQSEILNRMEELGVTLRYIINTHDHYDHAGGNEAIQAATGAQVVSHPAGRADVPVSHNEELSLGVLTLRFLHTPGHTPDSICVLTGGKLVTGDTLFVGKVGGTYSSQAARAEYDSLHNVLMSLPDETEVWPGHDVGVSPSSTIASEKASNPFILQPSFDAFLDLKNNWAEYKRKHGIA